MAYELPEDPSIDALMRVQRDAIAAHWMRRAKSELRVARAFEALRPRLAAAGAVDVVLELADKAIADETKHSGLCTQLASRYAGRDVASPIVDAHELVDFGTRDETLEVSLLVLGMCCVNESIASTWIRACYQAAEAPTAQFANRAHLQDEIDHARLGWAHFASTAVDDQLRAKVRPWVRRVLAANVKAWKESERHVPEEGIPAHGHLSRAEDARVIDEAVRDVVLPGLREVGLD